MTYSHSSSFFIIDSDHFKIRRNTWLRMQVHLNHRISDNPRASLIPGFATYFTPVQGGVQWKLQSLQPHCFKCFRRTQLVQYCSFPSSTILTVIIKTAVSWASVTSLYSVFIQRCGSWRMRHPRITLQNPDLRFQRALSVSGLHSSRHWHKLDPGHSTRQEQVVLAFRIEQAPRAAALSLSHTSPGTIAPPTPRPAPSLRQPRTQRGWHRERAAARRAPAMPSVPVRWRRPPGRAMFR